MAVISSSGLLLVSDVPSGNSKYGNRLVRNTMRPLPTWSMLSSTVTLMLAALTL